MSVLFTTHSRYLDHVPGIGHPERPERLEAVLAGARFGGVDDALVRVEPRPATRPELELVHPATFLDALANFCDAGGGQIDSDTVANAATWSAAVLAAGAGLSLIERIDAGEARTGFCAVRPPGHHASQRRAMGFCFVNNVAVAAAVLAARGERVVIVDVDAHHGNGTQAVFYDDPRVLYVSFHEYPLYPGTGTLDERGSGAGIGTTLNFPLPARATGDVYLYAIDRVLSPIVEMFAPTWLLISAGFDAHRRDPITELGLSSGDYVDITHRLLTMASGRPCLTMLEGGYDLEALASCTAATLGALAGVECRPEPSTSGGPGRHVVDAAARLWGVDAM
ncbi:MAG: histone deacetylase family protein [Acidimicrobiia bacterium]